MPQNKDQKTILAKLGIRQLNQMQKNAQKKILSRDELILLSPTGSGKTLAFLLPIIAQLDSSLHEIQALILVPSRELAMQIEQVARSLGSGYKVNAVYGGRAGIKDKAELKHPPAILIGTPGRVADHIRREVINTQHVKILVLDEFDKSLEIGFEAEMRSILKTLVHVKKKVLTSATQRDELPDFVGIKNPEILNYLDQKGSRLRLKMVMSPSKDKLVTLKRLLFSLGGQSGIVFCNLKETIETVSDYLDTIELGHVCFYGGMEQVERERSLIRFRNGSQTVLLATDLAARGIDVPEMDFIIHYELPYRKEEFVHRNGRTARMHSGGTAYVLRAEREALPGFIKDAEIVALEDCPQPPASPWETIYISGGRKDKISKGDIAGLFFKQGALLADELGMIELKQDCAFVAVPRAKASLLISKLNNRKLKKKKVRLSILS